jgi:hypothetical protein
MSSNTPLIIEDENDEKITIFEFRTQLDISIPHQFIMTYLNSEKL